MTQPQNRHAESDVPAEGRARARAERGRFVNQAVLCSQRKQFWSNLVLSFAPAAAVYWVQSAR